MRPKKFTLLAVFCGLGIVLAVSGLARAEDWRSDAFFQFGYEHRVVRGGYYDARESHDWSQAFVLAGVQDTDRLDTTFTLIGRGNGLLKPVAAPSPLWDVEDSPGVSDFKLYQAAIGVDGLAANTAGVTLGRQTFVGPDVIPFDGARAIFHDPARRWVQASAFIGSPVTFYEYAPPPKNPWGADLDLHPFLPGATIHGAISHLWETRWDTAWRQSVGGWLDAEIEYGALREYPDHLLYRFTFYAPWWDLALTASYRDQYLTQGNADNLAEIVYDRRAGVAEPWRLADLLNLGPEPAYNEYEGRAEFGFLDGRVSLTASYLEHDLKDTATETWFTASYRRPGIGLLIRDPGVPDFTIFAQGAVNLEARDGGDDAAEPDIAAAVEKDFLQRRLAMTLEGAWRAYGVNGFDYGAQHYGAGLEYRPDWDLAVGAHWSTEVDSYLQDTVGADHIDQTDLTLTMRF